MYVDNLHTFLFYGYRIYLCTLKERCRSGRSGRSRKPLSCVSGTEGSNPSLSASEKKSLGAAQGFLLLQGKAKLLFELFHVKAKRKLRSNLISFLMQGGPSGDHEL
jgi:hypothetical protein